jgi:peptidoglycan pentaglycine glycine transferase (the first glycine)
MWRATLFFSMNSVFVSSAHRATWDSYVAASPYGHILQSWEWGDIKERTGWRAIRLALCRGEEIQGAAQVLVRQLPYRAGTLAYVPKGPVIDYQDPAAVAAMIGALTDLASRERVISLKLEPEVLEPSPAAAELFGLGLVPAPPVQMRSSIWVDLSYPETEIMARQKQKTRYNIRLAGKKGVTVSEGQIEDLDSWYGMYLATARRDGFSVHDLEYYRVVLQTLQPRGMARLLLAHHEGDLLAGIIVFAFGRTGQYMYGASSNEKRNLMAPYLVQWEGMRWARSRGAIVYDLWGIPDRLQESEDLWGVYRHKRGYGGEIVRYIGAYDLVRAPVRHVGLERIGRPLLKQMSRRRV